jgi:4-amino-4-deoxy-L-arabinose transferase-like glycosyltransferase
MLDTLAAPRHPALTMQGGAAQPEPQIRNGRFDPITIGLLAAAGTVLMLLSVGLGANDLVGGDEGYYGVMARNIGHGWRYVASPALQPLGPAGDKPFLYPVLLSAAMRIGGATDVAVRFANLLMAVATAFFLALIGRTLRVREAGAWASLLYLTGPFLAYAGRTVQAETAVALFAVAGVWLLLRAADRHSRPSAFLAGVLFGCGFLCKIWLVLPAALAVALACLPVPLSARNKATSGLEAGRAMLPAAVVGFLVTAPLQFVLCAAVSPSDLGHWARICFGFSLTSRMSGQGFASYWIQPRSYYLDLIAHDVALCLPLLAVGTFDLIRRFRLDGGPSRRMLVLVAI